MIIWLGIIALILYLNGMIFIFEMKNMDVVFILEALLGAILVIAVATMVIIKYNPQILNLL